LELVPHGQKTKYPDRYHKVRIDLRIYTIPDFISILSKLPCLKEFMK